MVNANESLPNHLQTSDWYQQAKFGMFIHWGAYSVAGAEASCPIMAPDLSEAMFGTQIRIPEYEYRTLPTKFNPVDFDADMKKMAADPHTQAWWKLTDPCQQPLDSRQPGEWWASMEEFFHMD